MAETELLLRIYVWQPCRLVGEFMDANDGQPVDMSSKQSLLYSWEACVDILSYIASFEDTQRLQEVLTGTFSPERPHQERKIVHLQRTIKEIDSILMNANGAFWGDSEFERRLLSGERITLRQHPVLAFRHHLQWIYDTFGNVPNATVTVR